MLYCSFLPFTPIYICCTHLSCTPVYCFAHVLGQQFVEHFRATAVGTETKCLQPFYMTVLEYIFFHNYFQALAQQEFVKVLKFTIQ